MTSVDISAGRTDLGNAQEFYKSEIEKESDGPYGEKDPLFIGSLGESEEAARMRKGYHVRIQKDVPPSLLINDSSFQLTLSLFTKRPTTSRRDGYQ